MGKFLQNPPLNLRGGRGVKNEEILMLKKGVEGDGPNFREIEKAGLLILRGNLWGT